LGKCGGYTSDIVDAITWGSGGTVAGVPANINVAKVLNLSLGGGGPCASTEQAAITAAIGRGTVVVISAGNTNTNASNNSPGNCLGNITVAATQRQGIKASYSAFGTSVEIAAPGGGRNFPETPTITRNLVISTINTGATVPSSFSYAGYNGTSMSAPHVAGVASLMLSVNPALTPAQVLSMMQTTARPFPVVGGATCPSSFSCNCTTSLCGAGLLDAGAAVAMAVPAVATALPVYRFNAAGVYHFYTMSEVEKNYVLANFPTWTLEGVGFYAYPTQVPNTLPVYRFNAGGYHFYTIFESEKNAIIANLPTWVFEGIGFYTFPTATAGAFPVYRFNTRVTHFYTASEVEKDYVLANFPTWTLEGVGFYTRNAP
jgi:subtilisin family serine protease